MPITKITRITCCKCEQPARSISPKFDYPNGLGKPKDNLQLLQLMLSSGLELCEEHATDMVMWLTRGGKLGG